MPQRQTDRRPGMIGAGVTGSRKLRDLNRMIDQLRRAGWTVGHSAPPTMARLESCSDEELWQSARSRLSEEESARLESLHFQQQSTGLSADEKAELAKLLEGYERAILMRAQSVGLLQDRGHDVSGLLTVTGAAIA